MIPPGLAVSAASSVLGLISSVASRATSTSAPASGSTASSTPILTGTTTPATKKENDVVNQAEFMKLLIAQLQNQDPLNPLDSANFSSQLAQFSSLEQLTQINDKLTSQGTDKIGRFDAVGFIGRDVTGASQGIAVKDHVATTLDYTLTGAGAVQAKIVDQSGRQVANVVLGQQAAGSHTFDLSQVPNAPRLDDGTYAVVIAQSVGGAPATAVDTFVTGRVTGVDLTQASPVLLLGDRQLLLTDVTAIKEAAADSAA